jgi:hypothetical protein
LLRGTKARRWRWWARVVAAAPLVFLLTVVLLREPLDPTYRSAANPLGLRGGLALAVLGRPTRWRARSS